VEASAQKQGGSYLVLSRLTAAEAVGIGMAVLLALSLLLPWFTTSDNPNSRIQSANVGPNSEATGWETFTIFKFILLAAALAPFILAWIVARGHKLTWKPGEVTMIIGMTAFVLTLCNGIILGRPENKIEIGLSYGYLLALIASFGMAAAGFVRQAYYTDAKKPPGVI